MWERQAVKLSGVRAETEQKGTVETITETQWSDRDAACSHMKREKVEGGITGACTDPEHTTHVYTLD